MRLSCSNTTNNVVDLDYSARDCVKSLAKRFQHKNVNVTLYSLSLADSLVKNCGLVMHREISSRAFMDTLVQKVTLSVRALD